MTQCFIASVATTARDPNPFIDAVIVKSSQPTEMS